MQTRFAWVHNLFGPPTPCKFDPEEVVVRDTLIVYSLNDDEQQMDIHSLALKYPYKELD